MFDTMLANPTWLRFDLTIQSGVGERAEVQIRHAREAYYEKAKSIDYSGDFTFSRYHLGQFRWVCNPD